MNNFLSKNKRIEAACVFKCVYISMQVRDCVFKCVYVSMQVRDCVFKCVYVSMQVRDSPAHVTDPKTARKFATQSCSLESRKKLRMTSHLLLNRRCVCVCVRMHVCRCVRVCMCIYRGM